ncbi:MAG TPA: hypothetical protein DEH27_10345 [Deltaproteobacteria bacterium]|nr:hypothetical protein [Deltaproteobacteria bacterium]
MFPLAKFSVAPGWHCPQVTGRFFGFTVERGSAVVKISCTPWQEEQLATVLSPSRWERPWKLSLYPLTLSVWTPYRAASFSAAWHEGHVFSEMAMKETAERGSSAWRISCSPWQSVHPGASGTPRASATPWTLSRKIVKMP